MALVDENNVDAILPVPHLPSDANIEALSLHLIGLSASFHFFSLSSAMG
jgi:hypothetical protein